MSRLQDNPGRCARLLGRLTLGPKERAPLPARRYMLGRGFMVIAPTIKAANRNHGAYLAIVMPAVIEGAYSFSRRLYDDRLPG